MTVNFYLTDDPTDLITSVAITERFPRVGMNICNAYTVTEISVDPFTGEFRAYLTPRDSHSLSAISPARMRRK